MTALPIPCAVAARPTLHTTWEDRLHAAYPGVSPDRLAQTSDHIAERLDGGGESTPEDLLTAWVDGHHELRDLLGGLTVSIPVTLDHAAALEVKAAYMRSFAVALRGMVREKHIDPKTAQRFGGAAWLDDTDDYALTGKTRRGQRIGRLLEALDQRLDSESPVDQSFANTARHWLNAAKGFEQKAPTLRQATAMQATLVVSIDPVDIERLGEYGQVDRGSCFGRIGEHKYAPLALLQTPGSFVAMLQDEQGNDRARCWGVYQDPANWAVTNRYPRDGSAWAVTMSQAAKLIAARFGWTQGESASIDEGDDAIVYLNGDRAGMGRVWIDCDGLPCYRVYCDRCNEAVGHEDDLTIVADGDRVCDDCLQHHYRWVEDRQDYFLEDETVYSENEDCHLYDDDARQLANADWVSKDRNDLAVTQDGEWVLIDIQRSPCCA